MVAGVDFGRDKGIGRHGPRGGQHPRGQRVDDRRQRSPEPDLGRCYIPGRAVGATGITAGHPGAAEHQIVDFAGRDQH